LIVVIRRTPTIPVVGVNAILPTMRERPLAASTLSYFYIAWPVVLAVTSALAVTYDAYWPAFEAAMEDFAELMQRLLEIQSGGRERSPELIAEDERLMDALRKRKLGRKASANADA
jgi:hypothetical protein